MSAQTTLDLQEGMRRQRMYLAHHEEAKDYLIDEIDERLVARIPDGDETIVDDAHVILNEILAEDVELGFPECEIERRWLGAIFLRRHWVNTGKRQKTERPSRNATKVTVWRLDESKLED